MKQLATLFCSIVLFSSIANAQNWAWAEAGGSSQYDNGYDITTLDDGTSIITGNFQGTATFGSNTLISDGDFDVFIAKYDNTGFCQWASKGGGTFADAGYAVSNDAAGNIYLTGFINSTSATFGTTTINNTGFDDMILVKYDPNGNVVWAQGEGGGDNDYGQGISTDANGNSYVVGYYGATATFGTTNVSSQGFGDVYLAKYDSAGTLQWISTGNGSQHNQGFSVAHDSQGNSYITGNYRGSITFGTTTLTSAGVEDIFVVKYDDAGDVVWAKSAGGTDRDEGLGITVDSNDDVYLTGFFENSATFGSLNKTSAGARDCFFAKVGPNLGNFVYVELIGGATGNEEGRDVVEAFNGNMYIAGKFEGIFTAVNSDFISQGSADIFVAAYKKDGTALWAKTAGSNFSDEGYAVGSDNNSSAYATGYFAGASVQFGSHTATNSSNFNDAFIAKIEELLGANFSTQNTSICIDDCIDFMDNSSGTPVSWEWSFEGATPDTSNDQNPTNICYDSVGTFNVILKVVDGSNNDETTLKNGYITVDSCLTGINISFDEEDKIALYPNPTNNVVNFSKKVDKAIVRNMLGELILEKTNTANINLSGLPPTIYLIETTTSKGSKTTHKVFKL